MKEDRAQQKAKIWHAIAALATYAFALLMPTSVFWQIGRPAAENILPLYVSRGIYLSDVAIVALLTFSLAKVELRKLGPPALSIPLLLLIVLSLISTLSAISEGLAFYTAMRWVLAGFVYIWFLQDIVPLPRIAQLFVLGLSIQAVVGLAQVIGQAPLGLPGELALPAAQSGSAILEVDGARWLRAYGMTFHPNVLGGYLLVGLLLGLALIARRWYMSPIWWLLFLVLFLSFSRGAWVAALVAIPILATFLAWRFPERRRHLSITLAGAGLILLGSVFVWNGQMATRLRPLSSLISSPREAPADRAPPVAPTEQFSTAERLVLAQTAIDSVAARPWQGVGAGNFALHVQFSDPNARPQPVHNVPLLLAAEIGLIGGFLWLFIWVSGLVLLGRNWRLAGTWQTALFCAWLAIGIVALFDSYPWSLNSGRLLTVFVLGLAGRILPIADDQGQPCEGFEPSQGQGRSRASGQQRV